MSFPCFGSVRYGELRAQWQAVFEDDAKRAKWLSEQLVTVRKSAGPVPGDPEHEHWRWHGLDGNEKWLTARGPMTPQIYLSMGDVYAMHRGREAAWEIAAYPPC